MFEKHFSENRLVNDLKRSKDGKTKLAEDERSGSFGG